MGSNKNVSDAPLYEVIYDVLNDHLNRNALPVGLVLGEVAVARAFKTSRIPAGAALRKLKSEGLIASFEGRGFLVGPVSVDTRPIRGDLVAAGLELSALQAGAMALRTKPKRLYNEVEHAVATCLSYGRFMLNESALAEHYGVSRTIAHEILIKLERAGLLTQDSNQRWYAAPLTADLLRDHFELRWLLEPVALLQAAPKLDQKDLRDKHDHLAKFNAKSPPKEIENIEHELHHEIIGQCDNKLLRASILRSQLPTFATHSTFVDYQSRDEISALAADHLQVFKLLLAGKTADAALTLEAHIKRSLDPTIGLLSRLGSLPDEIRKPYLIQVGAAKD